MDQCLLEKQSKWKIFKHKFILAVANLLLEIYKYLYLKKFFKQIIDYLWSKV